MRDAAVKEMQSIDIILKPMNAEIEKIKSDMKILKDSLSNHVSIGRNETTL